MMPSDSPGRTLSADEGRSSTLLHAPLARPSLRASAWIQRDAQRERRQKSRLATELEQRSFPSTRFSSVLLRISLYLYLSIHQQNESCRCRDGRADTSVKDPGRLLWCTVHCSVERNYSASRMVSIVVYQNENINKVIDIQNEKHICL